MGTTLLLILFVAQYDSRDTDSILRPRVLKLGTGTRDCMNAECLASTIKEPPKKKAQSA
jgi:hypothetical protein